MTRSTLLTVGAMGVFYYLWSNRRNDDDDDNNSGIFRHSRRPRADGEAVVQYNDDEWSYLLATMAKSHFQNEDDNNTHSSDDCIYLDYNGTTPIYPEVLRAMIPYLTSHFGNPSSGHAFGRKPKEAVRTARKKILYECLGAPTIVDPSAIWFTSCGTESDNLAIQLALQCHKGKQLPHIVTSNVEHPAIEQCLKALEIDGVVSVTFVSVGTDGRVKAEDVIAAIEQKQDNTILVTIMFANNESGALQPVKEVSEYCRKHDILFHTDAAQACGKVSVQLEKLGNPDMITLVGHKIGAPKGVACLYVRPGCLSEHGRSLPDNRGILLLGGGQEHGRRGGTENVPYIVALGYAAAMAEANVQKNARHMEDMRCRLVQQLERRLNPVGIALRANGPSNPGLRLPNTLSVGLENIHSGHLLAAVGDSVAASAGAACHATASVSAVLRAMNVPDEFARGALRLSVGPKTTAEEVDRAVEILAKAAIAQHQTETI